MMTQTRTLTITPMAARLQLKVKTSPNNGIPIFRNPQSVNSKTLSKSMGECGIWAMTKQRRWKRKIKMRGRFREVGEERRRCRKKKGKGLVRDKTLGEPDMSLGVAGYILSLLEMLISNISKHKTKTSH